MGFLGDSTQDKDLRQTQADIAAEKRARIESIGKVLANPLARGKPLILNNNQSIIAGLITEIVQRKEADGKKVWTEIYHLSELSNAYSKIIIKSEIESYESIVNKWQQALQLNE